MMHIDLHCHSEASHDCITPLSSFPARCQQRGIAVQAITDHNQIWGAKQLQEIVAERGDKLTVIIGEEVSTREGEIIGLFLSECIPAGLSPEETIAEIRNQGGLVLLPHGFDPLKRLRLEPEARERVADSIDIVEVFNARISRHKWNAAASTWAAKRNVPESGGSDAHTLHDIGSAWLKTPQQPIDGPNDLMAALVDTSSLVDGEWTHPAFAFVYKMWDGLRDRFRSPSG